MKIYTEIGIDRPVDWVKLNDKFPLDPNTKIWRGSFEGGSVEEMFDALFEWVEETEAQEKKGRT